MQPLTTQSNQWPPRTDPRLLVPLTKAGCTVLHQRILSALHAEENDPDDYASALPHSVCADLCWNDYPRPLKRQERRAALRKAGALEEKKPHGFRKESLQRLMCMTRQLNNSQGERTKPVDLFVWIRGGGTAFKNDVTSIHAHTQDES